MMMMMMNECSGYASVGCGISLFLSSLSEGAIKIVEEGAFRAGRQALGCRLKKFFSEAVDGPQWRTNFSPLFYKPLHSLEG